jgi:hypothetical protein
VPPAAALDYKPAGRSSLVAPRCTAHKRRHRTARRNRGSQWQQCRCTGCCQQGVLDYVRTRIFPQFPRANWSPAVWRRRRPCHTACPLTLWRTAVPGDGRGAASVVAPCGDPPPAVTARVAAAYAPPPLRESCGICWRSTAAGTGT